jgi:hypothetical protein
LQKQFREFGGFLGPLKKAAKLRRPAEIKKSPGLG